jgi:hypothetical protein
MEMHDLTEIHGEARIRDCGCVQSWQEYCESFFEVTAIENPEISLAIIWNRSFFAANPRRKFWLRTLFPIEKRLFGPSVAAVAVHADGYVLDIPKFILTRFFCGWEYDEGGGLRPSLDQDPIVAYIVEERLKFRSPFDRVCELLRFC